MTDAPGNGLAEPARRLLENVLAGEIGAMHPEVIAMMQRDPAFARALERLLDVHHELMHLESPRNVAEFEPAAELEAAATAAMRRHMRASMAPPPPRAMTRRRLAILGAAAAIACVGFWLLQREPAPDRIRQPLDGGIEVAELANGDGLHFGYRLPSTGYFEVQVLDGDRTLLPATRVNANLVNAADWRPARELTATWPAKVTVRVTAFADASSGVASRSYEWNLRR